MDEIVEIFEPLSASNVDGILSTDLVSMTASKLKSQFLFSSLLLIDVSKKGY
jgi:hypothetical protein